ncbi:MAG TPA: hypothetical protein DD727_03450 [Clostridiales bacterium]|nr:hypothetical protein [Clostridiales bacterium]
MDNTTQILILGAGMAGLYAAEAATAKGAQVLMAGEEPNPPYWRPRLPRLLAGMQPVERILVRSPQDLEAKQIRFVPGLKAAKILPGRHQVIWTDGSATRYDSLVLAMGASPFIPSMGDRRDVLALRTYADAVKIRERALSAGKALVAGGGLLGLETAWHLKEAGVNVLVVEKLPWLLPRQLPRDGGEFLRRRLEASGLTVRVGLDPAEVGPDFEDACVVAAAGIRPNTALAMEAGIACGRGITADDRMETRIPGIYVCGDAAEYNGRNWGLIPVAQEQGRIAGENAAGVTSRYAEKLPSPMLRVGDVSVFSMGMGSDDAESGHYSEESETGYRCIRAGRGQVTGAALIGDMTDRALLTRAVAEAAPVSEAGYAQILDSLRSRYRE